MVPPTAFELSISRTLVRDTFLIVLSLGRRLSEDKSSTDGGLYPYPISPERS